MSALPRFRLERPRSLEEALRLLALGPGVLPVAGGTDLVPSMKQGLFSPRVLVDLKAVPELGAFRTGGQGAHLGAATRIARLRDDPDLARRYPALVRAAAELASPPVQNAATLGGNLCLDTRCLYYNQSAFWRRSLGGCLKRGAGVCRAAPGSDRCLAVSAADTVPALIALDARVHLVRWERGGPAERAIPLEDLYAPDGAAHLRIGPGEIATGVSLPSGEGLRSGFLKFRRRASIDYPLASVAVAFRKKGGRMHGVRIAVGGLGPAPVLAREAMEVLEGQAPTQERLERAAQRVTAGTRPAPNQHSTPGHRRRMARVMTRRLLAQLAGPGAPSGSAA